MQNSSSSKNMSQRISLQGVFDPARVEDILNTLALTIEQQNSRIASLEQELSDRPSQTSIQTLQQSIDQLGSNVQQRMAEVESRTLALEQQIAQVKASSTRWEASADALPNLATVQQLHAATQQVEATQQQMWEGFQETRRDLVIVKDLEAAQRHLTEQMNALQTLISCKADRAEVPLLKAAADTLKEAEEFRQQSIKRLDSLESDLAASRRILAQKEDKDAIVQRMQKIAEQLSKKADVTTVAADIIAPLQNLDSAFREFERQYRDADKITARLESIEQYSQSMNGSVQDVLQSQKKLDDKFFSLEKLAASKADVSIVSGKADTAHIEQTLAQLALEISQELATVQKIVGSSETIVQQLKGSFATLDQKTNVCLKFIDWYSDSALTKASSSFPPPAAMMSAFHSLPPALASVSSASSATAPVSSILSGKGAMLNSTSTSGNNKMTAAQPRVPLSVISASLQ